MLKKRIIPCLDIKNGRVVKGINFVDLVDAGDPAEQAKIYNDSGADEICFLDITASHEDRNTILEIVKKTTEKCFVPLTVGGGVRSIEDINNLLLAGADKVSINTAAVSNKNFIKEAAEKFGSQCIVVAVDAKKVNNNKWEVFTHGGRKPTGKDVLNFVSPLSAKKSRRSSNSELSTLFKYKYIICGLSIFACKRKLESPFIVTESTFTKDVSSII